MDSSEKKQLTELGKDSDIDNLIQKLVIGIELTRKEKTSILQIAIILLILYNQDNRLRGCREFAYYIFLKYAIITKDYRPLFDFSINAGLYPISNILYDKISNKLSLLSELTLSCSKELFADEKKNILTHEQREYIDEIVKYIQEQDGDIAYIAPTSYGKSSLITKIIRVKNVKKVGIIVPSKSLLRQTYKLIREAQLPYKILLHDEMFDNEEKFIAIFTQERALRFFDKYEKYFDLLFIDEAHNLLEKDQRSILISRVIKLNKIHNNNSRNIYLTPLLQDSHSIVHHSIEERKIQYSIKEPEYIEYLHNNTVRKYNRFFNNYYLLENSCKDYLTYIKEHSLYKNFIFLVKPKKIEDFSKKFTQELASVKNTEIDEIVLTLKNYVSPYFPMIDMVKKGCIYLHGKLPDEIKDYLEYKFQTISALKYMVANSVVLEGINMPIDTLFILNTYGQHKKSIVNLIGRVNRLNNIFLNTLQVQQSIEKLVPQIYFINSNEFGRKDGSMSNMIAQLRSSTFEDQQKNPMLKKSEKLNVAERKVVEIENIATTLNDKSLKARLIHHNIHSFYKEFDSKIASIEININSIKDRILQGENINPIDMIANIFIDNLQNRIENEENDFEFFRLENEKARNYYKNYFLNSRNLPLSLRVRSQVEYFRNQVKEGNSEFYIGMGFGEISKSSLNYPTHLKVYVDLSNRDEIYLTNISVIKLKIEQDFISYKLSRCFSFMYELKLLSDDEYNNLIYGTSNSKYIRYIKAGLSLSTIKMLADNKCLKYLKFDDYNNLYKMKELDNYLRKISDFDRFQLEKVL